MDLGLPKLEEFSQEKLTKKLFIHPNDDNFLPDFWRKPLSEIIMLINELPRTEDATHDFHIRLTNWNELYDGHSPWAIPGCLYEDESEEFIHRMIQRKMSIQNMYQYEECPEVQLGKILSKPFQKRMKSFEKSDEFAALGNKLYVLKVHLCPKHTSSKEDILDRIKDQVVLWRLLTCFGDTNLNAFHDQILAPAMGWRRNFHAYQYQVPTNGASIFPMDTSAMDRLHLDQLYSKDTADYDVRHFLRKAGDRLIYTYDMGDKWCHIITILKIQDVGTVFRGRDLETIDTQIFKAIPRKEWKLRGSSLLWGEINCPPENSKGCSGLGKYGDILKKGRNFEVPCHEDIINWKDHDIQCAYDFDLEAHRERFDAANAGRQNRRDGVLSYHKDPGSLGFESPCPLSAGDLAAFSGGRQSRKHVTQVDMECKAVETVRRRTVTKSKCNFCGKIQGSNSGLKLLECGRCRKTSYCSATCQKSDWKKHKRTCVPA